MPTCSHTDYSPNKCVCVCVWYKCVHKGSKMTDRNHAVYVHMTTEQLKPSKICWEHKDQEWNGSKQNLICLIQNIQSKY